MATGGYALGMDDSAAQAVGVPAQSGGLTGGLESLLSNPILQSALSGYLGYIGSPRYLGRGTALMHGGLAGLESFNQAEQMKQQLPLMQAQAQEAQARVPYMQAQAGLAQSQAKQLQRQMQGPTPEVRQAIETYKAQAKDPQEQAYIGMLEAQMNAGVISGDDVAKYLESYDEAKRMREMYQAQLAQGQANLLSQIPGMIPGLSGVGVNVGPGMTAEMTPSAGAAASSPPAPATPPSASLPTSVPADLKPNEHVEVDLPGKGKVTVGMGADGKPYYFAGGKWNPLS